jgi:hypothetical protein
VGEAHEVAGESVPADMGRLPGVGPIRQRPGRRSSVTGAAGVALPMGADENERTGERFAEALPPLLD